jgi:hypothetical protein
VLRRACAAVSVDGKAPSIQWGPGSVGGTGAVLPTVYGLPRAGGGGGGGGGAWSEARDPRQPSTLSPSRRDAPRERERERGRGDSRERAHGERARRRLDSRDARYVCLFCA